MIRILTKQNDEYSPTYVTGRELREWLKGHSDEEGNVTDDVVIYDSISISKADDGTYPWVMSDFTLDRDMERIDPEGWDLKGFKQNPVLLWSHDSMIPAIGMVLNPKKASIKAGGDKALVGKVSFDEDDPFAVLIQGKVDKGILSKGSVGFKPSKIEWVEDDKEQARLIYRQQELFEFSIVNIPSNPNAGRRSVEESDGVDSKSYIELMFEERRETSDIDEGETSPFDYLFDETEEYDTIESLLTGGQ